MCVCLCACVCGVCVSMSFPMLEIVDPFENFGSKVDRTKRRKEIKGGARKLATQSKRSRTLTTGERQELHTFAWSDEPEQRRVPLRLLLGRDEDDSEWQW